MNILYISYDGMTDPLGQSQVLPYLEGLCKKGHKFWILSFEKEKAFAEKHRLISSQLAKASINWLPQKYHSTPPVFGTLMDVKKLIEVSAEIVKKNNIDIVHCRSYISALAGLKLKKNLGVKFVFDMRGFWADERIEGGIWDKSNFIFKHIYRYFKKKELQYFSEADYTISLTNNGKNEIQSWKTIPNNPVPIKVIPCCADLSLFNIQKENQSILEELELETSTPVISYLGSVGTWYLLDEMLRFYKLYKQAVPGAKFLFITADAPSLIIDRAKALNIADADLIIKKADRKDVPKYLSVSSVSLFFIKQSFSKKASSPTKMGEIMGMGIPIICNSGVGDVGAIMEEVNPKAVVNSFSDKDFHEVLENIYSILGEDKQKIRELAQKYYSLEKGVEAYHSVYLSVCS